MNAIECIYRWAPLCAPLGLTIGAAAHLVRTRSLFHRTHTDSHTRFNNFQLPMLIMAHPPTTSDDGMAFDSNGLPA